MRLPREHGCILLEAHRALLTHAPALPERIEELRRLVRAANGAQLGWVTPPACLRHAPAP